MRAKLLPILALSVPVTVTVVLWLGTHEGPTSGLTTAGAVVGLPSRGGFTGRGDPTSLSVAAAFEERVATLETHVASAPENRDLRLALARLLHDGHREREAVEHYRKALAMDPDDARVYFDLATAYGALGDWEAAEGILLARLEQAPNDAVAMYDLGAVHANRGNSEEAESWWRKAEAAAKDDTLVSSVARALTRLEDARPR